QFFCNIFLVNAKVFIPRVETEFVVDETITFLKSKIEKGSSVKILDLCTGSGVIGITLMLKLSKLYDIQLTMSDISSEALEVCSSNCKLHNINARLLKGDLLEPVVEEEFDLIISNPPYIPNCEKLENIVIDNEPHISLFGGELGYEPYLKISKQLKKHPKTLISFEIGHNQGEVLIASLKNLSYVKNIQVKQDLFGNDRIVMFETE
ncbi:MAG: peptide chain release factor N(5)-glutamine methyltransferase, partial [Spiroplasma sp.]|nr:peptide chain release factor N(5)-glutamine methyltransferase [Mycoplasmatales bacterium]